MSKLSWIIYLLILAVIGWLVVVDMARGNTLGVSWEKSDSSGSYVTHSDILQPAIQVQYTAPVQKTQSSAQLHQLSEGVEMRPIEMLRSGSINE